MFDTMTSTKILGAGCGALLLFLLGGFGAEMIYHGAGGHGDEDHAQGYKIEVAAADDAQEEEVEEIDMAAMMLSAEAAAGEKVFSKCKACHKLDGSNGTGPHLDGVFGRAIGAVDGFGYSDTLASNGGTWDVDSLSGFLENPRGWAPGNKMSFPGLKKPTDRANIIAYLQSVSG